MAFNMSGFIQPFFAAKMLLSDDADGFNDRQLFVFPPQTDVLLDELKLPIPPNIPSLKCVYTLLRTIYSSPHTYMLIGDALDTTGSIMTNWFVVKVDKWMETFKGSCQKLGATPLGWQ